MWFESTIYREDKYRGEIEVSVEVEAFVQECKDAYATGDSPTQYDVKIESVIVRDSREFDNGENIVERIDESDLEYFEDQAIMEHKDGQ